MARSVPNNRGKFHRTGLAVSALKATLSSFSSSITESVTNMDSSSSRTLRFVVKSPTKSAHRFSWTEHKAVSMYGGTSLRKGGKWERHGSSYNVEITTEAFDSGGERNVFYFRFTNVKNPEKMWVAKENKYDVDVSGDVDFHRGNVITQTTAADYANAFNKVLKSRDLRAFDLNWYSVYYGPCYLCLIGKRTFFVEPFYEGKFQKWNTNSGGVKSKTLLNVISEGESDNDDDDDDDEEQDDYGVKNNYDEHDIPQAFTHWSYLQFSKRNGTSEERMICDLQGWFDKTSRTFQLIDPVIHSEKKGTFGRTDRGKDGIHDFFKTHQCSPVCYLLRLPENHLYQGLQPGDCLASSTSTSIPTSQFTVEKTHHLQRRQKERQITTRELQSAVKHGVKEEVRQPTGPTRGLGGDPTARIRHSYDGVSYITDAFSKVGITGYRDNRAPAEKHRNSK